MTDTITGSLELADGYVTRKKLHIVGNPGVGKVITMNENGELCWARIECGSGGAISLIADTHCGRLKRVNPRTGEREVVS